MSDHCIEDGLTEALKAISRVESVYLIPQGETVNVFTIIDNDDEETFDLIYDQERALLQRFGDVRLDFNVIARRGRSISEIMGTCNPNPRPSN